MNRVINQIFVLLAITVLLIRCGSDKTGSDIKNPKLIDYKVVNSFPHDRESFIQGFVVHRGVLYESTGQDNSWVGIVDIKTGKADKKVTLDKQYFGEGITILNNKVYQLTWENKKGFVYDLESFEQIGDFTYNSEGWGITHNNQNLVMSDGTSTLHFLDTVTLKIVKNIEVTYEGKPVNALNELEFIDGFIFANVWRTSLIAKIDINTGNIVGFLDLNPLVKQAIQLNPNADVLNGIAWHEGTESMLVTGKLWPYIYVLKLQQPV
ncbi:MAG: glutaminyl-peptide cyclotransferase [Cyclobacteriaceae bacterium]